MDQEQRPELSENQALCEDQALSEVDNEADQQILEALKERRKRRRRFVAIVLLLAIAAGAVFGILSGGAYRKWFHTFRSDEVMVPSEPTWDLSPMYASLEEARYALTLTRNEVERALDGSMTADQAVITDMMKSAERLQVYATLMRDSDLSDGEVKAFQTSVDGLVNKVQRLSVKKDRLDEPEPSIFELAGAYERVYQSFDHSFGTEFGADPELFSKKPERRYKAFQAWTDERLPSVEVFADIYEGKVGFDNYLAQVYGEPEAADAYLFMDGFSREAFDQLIAMTEQNLGLNHRWIALKSELIGLSGPMRFSDLFVSLPAFEAPLSAPEARGRMMEALAPLPEAGARVVQSAFDDKWIDFYPREDKYDGAYTYGAYESHPYLLLNFSGNDDSLEALAHELGHAVHLTLSAEHQPFDTYYADVTASELAASVTEQLFHLHRLERAETKDEKIAALAAYLDFLSTSYFDQMLATEFEVEAHRMAQDGEDLSADSLSALWRSLMAKYMGPAYEITELDGADWVSYPHLYWDFYMYKYATGVVASDPLARGLLSQDPIAADTWMTIMTAGGSQSGAQLLSEAGMDFQSEEIYKSFFRHMSERMDELEFLMNAS